MNLSDEISQLQKKAELYNVLKENINNAQEKINDAIALLNDAMKELNPVMKIKNNTQRREAGSNELIAKEYIDKMKAGSQISLKILHKEHPEFTDANIGYIFYGVLGKIDKVQKTKIDGKTHLFMDNTR